MTRAAQHDAEHRPPVVFDFSSPDRGGKAKAVRILARTQGAVCTVQAVGEGGENNLHAHPGRDGFWFVLQGVATFYTTDDEEVARLGPNEGIVIPADYPYWFESVDEQELLLLQFHVATTASPGGLTDDRVDLEARRPSYEAAVESAASSHDQRSTP